MSDTSPSPTLIFIPDISGFTEFVHTTEVAHSQHIVRELLEKIIDSNMIGLEISEIEGDAVLFFRMGDAPTADELLEQVRSMYLRFHEHLRLYKQQRICQCGACVTAHLLKLKFVAHYGVLGKSQVKNFDKLFGADLIVAHRLLKNEIPMDEYLLVTQALQNSPSRWENLSSIAWDTVTYGQETYDFGDIEFVYVAMESLASEIKEPEIEDFGIRNAETEVLRQQIVINAPIDMVFDVVSDVSFRHRWQPVKDSQELNGAITHTGSTHRCVINGNSKDPFQISHGFEFDSNTITWTETDTVNKVNNVLRLESLGANTTAFTIAIYVHQTISIKLVLALGLRRKLQRQLQTGFQHLQDYVKKLKADDTHHPNRIMLK